MNQPSETTPQQATGQATEAAPAPTGRLQRLRSNTFLKHVLTLMTGTAVAQLLPLVARPFLSRMYSDAEFGIYTLFLSLTAGLVTIGALRYDLAVVMPDDDGEARSIVRLASRLALLTSGVATIVLVLFAHPVARWLGNPALGPYLPAVGVLVFAMTQLSSRQYWLNRRQRYKEMARNRMGQAAGTTVTHLGAGLAGLGVWGLVLGSLVGQWFSMLNLLRLTRHETQPQAGDPSLGAVATEHRKMPLANGPNALVDTIRLNGIPLMLGAFFGKSIVGQFGQAWQLLQMPMGLVNGALSQVFYQKLARTRRGTMFPVVRNAIVRSLVIGLVPFALIWLLSPWLFPFVLGNKPGHDWHLAGLIARALVPWLYLNFVTSPVSLLFVTVRRQGTMFAFACAYMAVPLGLIWRFHHDILQTVGYVSWAMAALLVVFIGLALLVSRQYDNGVGSRTDRDDDAVAETEARADELEAEDAEPGPGLS